jgi:putative membrane protein
VSDPHDPTSAAVPFDPRSITRPDPALQTYYILVALLTLAGFPFVVVPLLFKYHTLRYEFDDDGVKMSWGVLFRREIVLTYRRIQDIHVTRNIIQRWLGLASVAVQTASGASGAEMTIEGLRDPEALRDFLYDRMRGARGDGDEQAAEERGPADESLALLREIRDELRARRRGPGGGAS